MTEEDSFTRKYNKKGLATSSSSSHKVTVHPILISNLELFCELLVIFISKKFPNSKVKGGYLLVTNFPEMYLGSGGGGQTSLEHFPIF